MQEGDFLRWQGQGTTGGSANRLKRPFLQRVNFVGLPKNAVYLTDWVAKSFASEAPCRPGRPDYRAFSA